MSRGPTVGGEQPQRQQQRQRRPPRRQHRLLPSPPEPFYAAPSAPPSPFTPAPPCCFAVQTGKVDDKSSYYLIYSVTDAMFQACARALGADFDESLDEVEGDD